jgi:hypothetical protein
VPRGLESIQTMLGFRLNSKKDYHYSIKKVILYFPCGSVFQYTEILFGSLDPLPTFYVAKGMFRP